MKLIFKFIFLFLFSFTFLNAQFNIEIIDLVEYKMNDKKLIYKISAEKKTLNNQNLKKSFLFLNKENLISNNIYYSNGVFETKDMKIEFKKAYFLEGNFVMIETNGFYKEYKFNSNKTTFKHDKLELENTLIKIDEKQYKKLKYMLEITY